MNTRLASVAIGFRKSVVYRITAYRFYSTEPDFTKEPAKWTKDWLKYKPQYASTIEDPNNWEYTPMVTGYAHELITKEEKHSSAGVYVIELDRHLRLEEYGITNLYTTTNSRAVWDHVYDGLTNNRIPRCVVSGNPGIGKSRSVTYLLRKLLRDNMIVYFDNKKENLVYAFIPFKPTDGIPTSDFKYVVYESNREIFNFQKCAGLQNTDNFFLADTKNPATETPPVLAHTVIAAAPNKNHYQDFLKRYGSVLYFISPWKWEELAAIRKVSGVKGSDGKPISEEELRKRYKLFGGIPRHVFATQGQFETMLVALENAVSGVKEDTILRALSRQELNDDNLPSMVFQCVATQSPFQKFHILPISEYVTNELMVKYWTFIMNYLHPSINTTGLEKFEEMLVQDGGVINNRK